MSQFALLLLCFGYFEYVIPSFFHILKTDSFLNFWISVFGINAFYFGLNRIFKWLFCWFEKYYAENLFVQFILFLKEMSNPQTIMSYDQDTLMSRLKFMFLLLIGTFLFVIDLKWIVQGIRQTKIELVKSLRLYCYAIQ